MINELHKCITKKFSRCKVYSPYRDNIWGANPAHVKLTLIKLRFLKLIIFVGVNSNHRPPPPPPTVHIPRRTNPISILHKSHTKAGRHSLSAKPPFLE